jgi:hypothetical protein
VLVSRRRVATPVELAQERAYHRTVFDRAVAIKIIRAGICACSDCHGNLTDPALSKGGWGFCRDCRCARKIATPDGKEYAATVPSATHLNR